MRAQCYSRDGTEGAFVKGCSGEALSQRRARQAAQKVSPRLRPIGFRRPLGGISRKRSLRHLPGGKTLYSRLCEPCISRSAASGTFRAWTLRPNQPPPSAGGRKRRPLARTTPSPKSASRQRAFSRSSPPACRKCPARSASMAKRDRHSAGGDMARVGERAPAQIESRRAGESGSRLRERFSKPSRASTSWPLTADELTADAVSWITARLPDRDRNPCLTEPDAQRQSRQAAADDRDGFQCRHGLFPSAAQRTDD